MASITVRNLDEGLKQRLRIRAAQNGKSMEQEVRDILKDALGEEVSTGKNILRASLDDEPLPGKDLASTIRARFAPFGGVELELPPRGAMREPPKFD